MSFTNADLDWVSHEMRALLPKLEVYNSWDCVSDFCKMRVYALDPASGIKAETQIDVPGDVIRWRDAAALARLTRDNTVDVRFMPTTGESSPPIEQLAYSSVDILDALQRAEKAFE